MEVISSPFRRRLEWKCLIFLLSFGIIGFSSGQFFDPNINDIVYLDMIQETLAEEVNATLQELLVQARLTEVLAKQYVVSQLKRNLFLALREIAEKELAANATVTERSNGTKSTTSAPKMKLIGRQEVLQGASSGSDSSVLPNVNDVAPGSADKARQEDYDEGPDVPETPPKPAGPTVQSQVANLLKTIFGFGGKKNATKMGAKMSMENLQTAATVLNMNPSFPGAINSVGTVGIGAGGTPTLANLQSLGLVDINTPALGSLQSNRNSNILGNLQSGGNSNILGNLQNSGNSNIFGDLQNTGLGNANLLGNLQNTGIGNANSLGNLQNPGIGNTLGNPIKNNVQKPRPRPSTPINPGLDIGGYNNFPTNEELIQVLQFIQEQEKRQQVIVSPSKNGGFPQRQPSADATLGEDFQSTNLIFQPKPNKLGASKPYQYAPVNSVNANGVSLQQLADANNPNDLAATNMQLQQQIQELLVQQQLLQSQAQALQQKQQQGPVFPAQRPPQQFYQGAGPTGLGGAPGLGPLPAGQGLGQGLGPGLQGPAVFPPAAGQGQGTTEAAGTDGGTEEGGTEDTDTDEDEDSRREVRQLDLVNLLTVFQPTPRPVPITPSPVKLQPQTISIPQGGVATLPTNTQSLIVQTPDGQTLTIAGAQVVGQVQNTPQQQQLSQQQLQQQVLQQQQQIQQLQQQRPQQPQASQDPFDVRNFAQTMSTLIQIMPQIFRGATQGFQFIQSISSLFGGIEGLGDIAGGIL